MQRHHLPGSGINRRRVVGAAAAGVALLFGAKARAVAAQDATPEPTGVGVINGKYGVTRRYAILPDADIAELTNRVQGFVEIVAAVPGFVHYEIVLDEENLALLAVGIFDSAESAEESNAAARDYVVEYDTASFYESPTPEYVQGSIIASAAA